MQMNPALKKLGFDQNDRVVILHADDIGMCQASVSAYSDLVDFGLMSSAATMVPCPWFPSVAEYCRQHPDVDMGVHLTLTCEWDQYRWAPISTADRESGLMDDEGYFHRSSQATQTHAQTKAVEAEIEAQIKRALDAGIVPTHIDSHMGTVAHPRFVPLYIQASLSYRLPTMSIRWDAAQFQQQRGVDAAAAQSLAEAVATLEDQGIPLFDQMSGMPLSGDKPIELAQKILGELPPGLTMFIFHPSQDTPELRAIAPDWAARVADYELFSSEKLRTFIQQEGIQVIGYRQLRDLMRP